MKANIKIKSTFYALSMLLFGMAACNKDEVTTEDSTTTSDLIAVAASASVANADTVYLVQSCRSGETRDSVSAASLPAAVSTYLSSSYAGYTFHKAFALKDSTGTVSGYVVVIYYNDKPVGLQFDSTGSFVKLLEQRKKRSR